MSLIQQKFTILTLQMAPKASVVKRFGLKFLTEVNQQVNTLRKGLVLRCSTDEEGVEPAVVAQKIYFWTFDKNMTESELINTVRVHH